MRSISNLRCLHELLLLHLRHFLKDIEALGNDAVLFFVKFLLFEFVGLDDCDPVPIVELLLLLRHLSRLKRRTLLDADEVESDVVVGDFLKIYLFRFDDLPIFKNMSGQLFLFWVGVEAGVDAGLLKITKWRSVLDRPAPSRIQIQIFLFLFFSFLLSAINYASEAVEGCFIYAVIVIFVIILVLRGNLFGFELVIGLSLLDLDAEVLLFFEFV